MDKIEQVKKNLFSEKIEILWENVPSNELFNQPIKNLELCLDYLVKKQNKDEPDEKIKNIFKDFLKNKKSHEDCKIPLIVSILEQFLESKENEIEEYIENDIDKYLSEETLENQKTKVMTYLESANLIPKVQKVLNNYFDKNFGKSTSERSMFDEYILASALPWALDEKTRNERMYDTVVNTFDSLLKMKKLEKEKPGSIANLRKNFNLDHFYRYPIEILKRQCDLNTLPKKPGLVIFGKSDHNNSMARTQDSIKKLDSFSELTDGVLIFEGREPVKDIRKLSLTLRKYIKENTKIPFVNINGHGSPDSIEFEMANEKGLFNVSKEISEAGKYTKEIFTGTTFLLDSCCAGIILAQKLSEEYKTIVIAPLESGISIMIENQPITEEVIFKVNYIGEKGEHLKTIVYKEGTQIQQYSW